MVNGIIRHSSSAGITIAAYFEPLEAAVKVTPGGADLRPAGQVFELFTAHRGGTLRPIGGDTQPDIDLAVTLHDTGERIVATVVNKNVEEQQEAVMDVHHLGKAVECSGVSLCTGMTGARFAL